MSPMATTDYHGLIRPSSRTSRAVTLSHVAKWHTDHTAHSRTLTCTHRQALQNVPRPIGASALLFAAPFVVNEDDS